MIKKILMVIAKEKFRDEEFLNTKQVLENNGIEIKVAGLETGQAIGMFGAKTQIDLLIKDVRVDDFNGVAFIGGGGIIPFVDNEDLKKIAIDFYQKNKLVSAICAAPAILAKAGILKEKKATIYSSMIEDIKKSGAVYQGNQIEVDGQIITADGPLAAKKFGEAIVQGLE